MQELDEGPSVSQACYSVGFESMGSFSTQFKRICRLTPTDYLIRCQSAHYELQINFSEICARMFCGKKRVG